MSFKDDVANDLKEIILNTEEFAEEIVYVSSVIKAVVKYSEYFKYEGSDVSQKATIYVDKKDVPAPKIGDLVVIDSSNWSTDAVASGNMAFWVISIRRDERVRFRN